MKEDYDNFPKRSECNFGGFKWNLSYYKIIEGLLYYWWYMVMLLFNWLIKLQIGEYVMCKGESVCPINLETAHMAMTTTVA